MSFFYLSSVEQHDVLSSCVFVDVGLCNLDTTVLNERRCHSISVPRSYLFSLVLNISTLYPVLS
ncbi:MAG: hypothetical protein MRJ93_13970 [Nitrososphaeraceae archaeon]|nr:hypothetical protein [Nitrososphaeraceae archaeon]